MSETFPLGKAAMMHALLYLACLLLAHCQATF